MVVQKINKQIEDSFDLAFKYYTILSTINDMGMVKRDIQLISYAISNSKHVSDIKTEFVEKFGTSMATVGNIISKLYRLNVLKKEKRVIKINPLLLFDFEGDLVLQIILKHGDKG